MERGRTIQEYNVRQNDTALSAGNPLSIAVRNAFVSRSAGDGEGAGGEARDENIARAPACEIGPEQCGPPRPRPTPRAAWRAGCAADGHGPRRARDDPG